MKQGFFDKNMSFYLSAAFINAFVDLGHKITIQNIIFKTMSGSELLIMTQIVNALILLPFVLFFIPAGEMNDKRSKLKNMKTLALAAVLLCVILTVFYAAGFFWASFLATLALGTQAAFYSPAKFGFAKELSKDEAGLAKINSALQSISIVSILLSTLAFSIAFEALSLNFDGSKEEYTQIMTPIGVSLTILSVLEYLLLSKITAAEYKTQNRAAQSRIIKYRMILSNDGVLPSMVLLSLFFALSQSVMASFPSFAKDTLGIKSVIATQAAMAISAVGIIVGSYLAGNYKNSRHRVAFVFFGMIGYSLFLALLLGGEIYFSFFCIGVAAGFIMVPLNTLIQERAQKELLGSGISLSNLLQNILMLLFLGAGVAAAIYGFEAKNILLLCSIIAFLAAVYSLTIFPQPVIEAFMAFLFGFKYRFKRIGTLPTDDRGKILVGNHVSYIDWAFLQMAVDKKIHFMMEKEIYDSPILKPFLSFFGALPIDSKNAKSSMTKAVEILNQGGIIVLFPEGELTKDGNIGEFKRGFEFLAQKSGADVYPFYIDGLFTSRFSKKPIPSYKPRRVSIVIGGRLGEAKAKTAKKAVEELRFKI